ncbi:hypothetical protein BN159_5031 [Streptomyces davaonensis JCM 4913]|uniref:DUF397 domain-containing protein n=1 Tax=Streptomyces davaonensis (strain DSM 101723 / JCM 4913 / KCC S-0913 / 768) TaxID=1214101 RepID=K4R8P1_STRDJ|nr:DUF397 domain-containing protein [Streptomyces davaonensis]CCK29410.1 hypothetical protein BN159_5031 [Streptomyces davaonensis JCM 4913]
MTPTPLTWFKSSYSSADGPDCVEVAVSPAAPTIHIRDSKNRDGAQLAFGNDAWSTFVNTYSA